MNPKVSLLFVGALAVAVAAQEGFTPARLRTYSVPTVPTTALGGGQVILEITVDPAGRVAGIVPLRTTPPFTELTMAAVREWQFAPATIARRTRASGPAAASAVPSKVLVAAVFHAPALNAPTLGQPPRDVATASSDVAFPLTIASPPLTPLAAGSGIVLLEARVDGSGRVAATVVKHAAPPFDNAAQTALRQWTFRPAQVGGSAGTTFVYVMFGFPVPVTNGSLRQ